MVLGRLIRSVNGERFSTIRTTRMTKVFVAGDILALNVQGNAAGLTVKQSTQKIGQAIITVGLFIQLILFGLFVTAAVVFHKRMRREVGKGPELRPDVPWRQGLKMLYTCSALIIVRSIFRIVEYTMGPDGYPLSHEWPAYTFDGSLMLAVQIIFVVWYPDKFQTRQSDIELTMMRLVSNEQ